MLCPDTWGCTFQCTKLMMFLYTLQEVGDAEKQLARGR